MDDLILLDGGTGRELKRRGAPFRQPEWSALALIEAPEAVGDVHAAYIAAGADVVTANSYALTPFHLGDALFAARGLELAGLAGRLAADAAHRAGRRAAGSLPPVCGSYRPDLFDPDLARPRLEVLIQGLAPHVDLMLAETLSSAAEARLVREALGPSPLPLWLSFTLEDANVRPGDPRLRSGEPASAAVDAAAALGAEAVLFNCSQPEVMADALRVAHAGARAGLRIGAYANAFPPQRADAEANADLHELRRDLDPDGYLAFARTWRTLGADVIGGCCGVGPEHITRLRREFHPKNA